MPVQLDPRRGLRRRLPFALWLLLAGAPAAAEPPMTPAEPPAAAATGPVTGLALYAFPASVQVLNPEAGFTHDPRAGGPPNPTTTVDVAAQAQAAYSSLAARMFAPGPGEGGVRLEVTVLGSSLPRHQGAWLATVRHQLVVRAGDGAEVDRFSVRGEAAVVGLEAQALSGAMARAARSAAASFEAQFDTSPLVTRWLAARGFARRVLPVPAAPPPPPRRPAWVGSLDGGVGYAGGLGAGLRAGVSGPWFYAQLTGDLLLSTFEPGAPGGEAKLTTTLVGVEAGLAYRLGDRVELRLGAGVAHLDATAEVIETEGVNGPQASVSIPKSTWCGSLSGAALYVTPPFGDWHLRGRIGLEARLLSGAELQFDAFQQAVTPASGSLFLLVGLELPVAK